MNRKILYSILIAALTAGILFLVFMYQNSHTMDRPEIHTNELTLTMYHGEGCACCIKWAEYLESHGVTVIEEMVDNLQTVKREYGVPAQLGSCHTAIVDGYVIEGHVPIEDIRRLVDERPDVIGISVPGMPPNAPGMDIPVSREYHVIRFDKEQNMEVYNTHK